MTWRRWTVLLAVFGLLVHAGALVRHITIVGSPFVTEADASTTAGPATVLCDHGGDAGGLADDAQSAPGHHKHAPCPICASGAATTAVLSDVMPLPIVVQAAATVSRRQAIAWHGEQRLDWPQSRAPPSTNIA